MNKPFCQTLRAWTAVAMAWMATNVAAQLKVEYYFDTDPGIGNATKASAAVDANGDIDFAPSTAGLSAGDHLLGIRALSTVDGTIYSSPTLLRTINVPLTGASVSLVEYFWDNDPGFGNATQASAAVDANGDIDFAPSTAGLSAGDHILGIRALSTVDGTIYSSPTLLRTINVPLTGASVSLVEYFWDNDPGFGNATQASATIDADGNIDFAPSTEGLAPGTHKLGIRGYGANGWSPTITSDVAFVRDEASITITEAEYFFDTDPGFGEGFAISITEGQAIDFDALPIDVSTLSGGDHLLGIRYRGTDGWSPTQTYSFFVPTVRDEASITITEAEYFWNEDPGFGAGRPIAITPAQELNLDNLEIPTSDIHGDATLYIRYRGTEGWGPTLAYDVMGDAEGNYTLNATAATDRTTRNFQTLGEAVADFAGRGVGADITLTIPTTSRVYSLDATTEDVLTQFTTLAESLDRTASPQTVKVITFTAAEGSGNTLAITTTDEGLPTVVAALTHTRLENVALTINGTAYDFAPATVRHEEVCSSEETTARPLSAISSAVKVTWKAQPHAGTTIKGYLLDGEGDLAAMTLTNSGARLDSLAYAVTLSDTEGRVLATYTYTIYVHARVSGQSFSGMTPTNGSRLDPSTVTLRWNAVNGVTNGYRIDVTDESDGTFKTYDTFKTSETIEVEEGHSYTWTVTAYGECDEVTSTAMTFIVNKLDIDVADLSALRQLYEDFEGAKWNGTPWDITASRITAGNWSGVTFDAAGRVTAINLSRRGLSGHTLKAETLAPMTALTSLNLSYNQIDELTAALPATITTLDLSSQHRAYGSNTEWPGIESTATQEVTVGANEGVAPTSVMTYDHAAQAFTAHPTLNVYTESYTQIGQLTWSAVTEAYTFAPTGYSITAGQDSEVRLVAAGSLPGRGSAEAATMHFLRGDANLSGLVDVNDVQHTLNEVLGTRTYWGAPFGWWSANTYTEDETEPVINIQDIVCTVDIVLDNETTAAAVKRRMAAHAEQEETTQEARNTFYADGHKLMLRAEEEIAAFDLELCGVAASQVRLQLSGRDWQMATRSTADGVRVVVFSPTGETLKAGTTELLRLSADGVPVAVQATSPEAEEVESTVAGNLPTGVTPLSDAVEADVYDLGGRKVAERKVNGKSVKGKLPRGVYIVGGRKVGRK